MASHEANGGKRPSQREKGTVPPTGLVAGRFLARLNRFAALVEVQGVPARVHIANSGRLGELLVQGRSVFLNPSRPASPGTAAKRRTAYDLSLVDLDGILVSVDARVPGELVARALREGRLPPFSSYTRWEREVRWGQSRLDFLLAGDEPSPPCLLEVKSVTLVEDGTARFPDAPTERGRRHLQELMQAHLAEGWRTAVLFVVQRDDAHLFAPNDHTDPAFGHQLREAAAAGVEVYAYRCHVSLTGVTISGRIPVRLSTPEINIL